MQGLPQVVAGRRRGKQLLAVGAFTASFCQPVRAFASLMRSSEMIRGWLPVPGRAGPFPGYLAADQGGADEQHDGDQVASVPEVQTGGSASW